MYNIISSIFKAPTSRRVCSPPPHVYTIALLSLPLTNDWRSNINAQFLKSPCPREIHPLAYTAITRLRQGFVGEDRSSCITRQVSLVQAYTIERVMLKRVNN